MPAGPGEGEGGRPLPSKRTQNRPRRGLEGRESDGRFRGAGGAGAGAPAPSLLRLRDVTGRRRRGIPPFVTFRMVAPSFTERTSESTVSWQWLTWTNADPEAHFTKSCCTL